MNSDRAQSAPPRPNSARYNDWQRVDITPLDEFIPHLPVSVIIPYYEQQRALSCLLAALERQSYPHNLYEIIIVDDGSRVPLNNRHIESDLLDIKIVHQERRGFGLSRARHNGAEHASHDILLFVDADMLPECEWITAHARWHHVVSDALTMGYVNYISMEDVNDEHIRAHHGPLDAMFARYSQHADTNKITQWFNDYMKQSHNLVTTMDNIFNIILGGNFGIGRQLYEETGGFDISFARYGCEDTELAYRAYTYGGLIIPAEQALSWHPSITPQQSARSEENLRLQYPIAGHRIAHPDFRPHPAGRIYSIPSYVVTIDCAHIAIGRVFSVIALFLTDYIHDIVVRIEIPADHAEIDRLRNAFDPEPRVTISTSGSALHAFPTAPFHITLHGYARDIPNNMIHKMRMELGAAVMATVSINANCRMTITRTWALHRARRAHASPQDFGDTRIIPLKKMRDTLLVRCRRALKTAGDTLKRAIRFVRRAHL